MNFIKELQELDTAEISDALDACGIEGALLGIKPLSSGIKLVGSVFTVRYMPYNEKPSTFKSAGNYIDDVPPNSVILIDNQGRKDCTIWGDLLTQVAVLKNIAGTVVYGAVRDVEFIKKIQYPLYSSSIYMRTGKNRVFKAEHQKTLLINGVLINPGDMLVGDDNGTVVIPENKLSEVIEKAKNIKITEQKIMCSVKSGVRLEDARIKYHYDQPWLKS